MRVQLIASHAGKHEMTDRCPVSGMLQINQTGVRKSETPAGTKEDPQQCVASPVPICDAHFSNKGALLLVKLLASLYLFVIPSSISSVLGVTSLLLNSNAITLI